MQNIHFTYICVYSIIAPQTKVNGNRGKTYAGNSGNAYAHLLWYVLANERLPQLQSPLCPGNESFLYSFDHQRLYRRHRCQDSDTQLHIRAGSVCTESAVCQRKSSGIRAQPPSGPYLSTVNRIAQAGLCRLVSFQETFPKNRLYFSPGYAILYIYDIFRRHFLWLNTDRAASTTVWHRKYP